MPAVMPAAGTPGATRGDLLRQLHAFLGVAECGGMRTACGRLVRAPSSVTRAIASLERLLAVALFERSAHGMLPTASGSRWTTRFGAVLAELQCLRRAVAALAGTALPRFPSTPTSHPPAW